MYIYNCFICSKLIIDINTDYFRQIKLSNCIAKGKKSLQDFRVSCYSRCNLQPTDNYTIP